MISYSDYILANRPWAYWPLNDPKLDIYNETRLLMDITGNERHLSLSNHLIAGYTKALPFFDSVPIRGIRAGHVDADSVMPMCYENPSKIWLASGDHLNDVSPERTTVSHKKWEWRIRSEFLMSTVPIAMTNGKCVPMMYPIIMVGGVSLWMRTIWYMPCSNSNCGCVSGASNLILASNARTHCYNISGNITIKASSLPLYWFPYFINYEGEIVQTGRDTYAGPLYDSKGTGMFIKDRRVIIDFTYINNKTLIVSAIIDDGVNAYSIIDTTLVLPEEPHFDYWGQACYTSFFNETFLSSLSIYGGPIISNLSVYYNNTFPLTYDYLARSWQALKTTYQPESDSNIGQLSDNVNTSRIVNIHPNSMLAQFDTVLCRGTSHRLITNLTATNNNGQSVIRLMLPHSFVLTEELPLHDFIIGDLISLQGSSQNLNGIWRIEAIDTSSVSFSLPGSFNNETGLLLVKRPPIGGGAWEKTQNESQIYYKSSTSQIETAILVDDISKSSSMLRILDTTTMAQSNALFLKRNLKRPSHHYQADTRQTRPEWTIIGDDKRFFFAIAYKQNPKDHTHLIVFGEIKDWLTDEWRTMLVGYVNETIGNVGTNALFAYPEWSILESGHLLCQSKKTIDSSDAVWISSDVDGDYTYLRGTHDCGLRIYPIPIPYLTF